MVFFYEFRGRWKSREDEVSTPFSHQKFAVLSIKSVKWTDRPRVVFVGLMLEGSVHVSFVWCDVRVLLLYKYGISITMMMDLTFCDVI